MIDNREEQGLNVEVINHQCLQVQTREVAEMAEKIWVNEGRCHANIRIILVSDDFIRNLNRQYLDKDYATDVMAFPYSDRDADPFEGEIYISVERVKENAAQYQTTQSQELHRVVAHGILHFLGYRDQTEFGKQRMRDRENYYLN